MVEQFLITLRCMECGFIGDEVLEQLPAPSIAGKTRVGGIDTKRLRTRLAMKAVMALATSPKGFTASDLATNVHESGGLAGYHSRQAAYDLKKLRGKHWVAPLGIHVATNHHPKDCGQWSPWWSFETTS